MRCSTREQLLIENIYNNHIRTGTLLLETPATANNIKRFLDKYLRSEIDKKIKKVKPAAAGSDELIKSIESEYTQKAKEALTAWTPRIQQIAKNMNKSTDVFGYSTYSL
jgi:hypothetical protein